MQRAVRSARFAQDYPYGEKELKKSIGIAGVEVPTGPIDPRIRVAAVLLGLLSFLPIFLVGLIGVTPGTQSPFNFLDRFYPPAIEAKEKKAAKAGKAAPKPAEKKSFSVSLPSMPKAPSTPKAPSMPKIETPQAKAKKEAEAKAKAEADAKAAKAKAEAEAKAKAEAAAKAKDCLLYTSPSPRDS